jgi:hypothetical protein
MDVKLKLKTGTGGEFNLLNNYSYIGLEAGCKYPDLAPKYIDNLCRLGLLHMPAGRHLISPSAYDILIKSEEYEKVKANYETDNTTTTEIRKYIELTELGVQFKEACVINKGD